MSIIDIIYYTPVWVWPLFAFLLLTGIAALRPRKARPAMMLLIPIFFFVWGLYAIFMKLPSWPITLGAFVVGLGVGFGLGWVLARRYPAATYDRESRRVSRPGSPLTLIFILFSFSAKYALSVVIATNPHLSATVGFLVLYGSISGVVSGIFAGNSGLQLLQAFNYVAPDGRPLA